MVAMEDRLGRESKKAIKKRWVKQYKELEKMMNAWDPLGLIRGGAPDDEYDCLSTHLLTLLHKGMQLDEIKKFVFTTLDQHFGLKAEDVKVEYRERYINRVNTFCLDVYNWFNAETGNGINEEGE